jgi:hypothetical protein
MKLAPTLALLFGSLASLSTAVARPLVDVSITDQTAAHVLPTYLDRGETYVAGVPGHRYSLTLRNNSGERVLAVVSVDGVNAVTGQTASAQQAGYVLGPWETAEVKGWRKSLSDVAEFYFTELPDSYAARTGRPDNVGVIGVAVFRERVRRPIAQPSISKREYERDDRVAQEPPAESRNRAADAAAAPPPSVGASAARAPQPASPVLESESMAKQQLGTGHGERVYDRVDTTTFERLTSRPQQVVKIFYDDYDTLVARGIISVPYRKEPEAFPVGFVPDPY